jgi:hypothetical protein
MMLGKMSAVPPWGPEPPAGFEPATPFGLPDLVEAFASNFGRRSIQLSYQLRTGFEPIQEGATLATSSPLPFGVPRTPSHTGVDGAADFVAFRLILLLTNHSAYKFREYLSTAERGDFAPIGPASIPFVEGPHQNSRISTKLGATIGDLLVLSNRRF